MTAVGLCEAAAPPTELERQALALSAAEEALWEWTVGSEQLRVSPLWWHQLGEPPCDLADCAGWLERVHPDDLAALQAALQDALEGRTSGLAFEYRIRRGDGEYRWMWLRAHVLRTAGGAPCRMIGAQHDVTARRLTEAELRRAALYDPLTGLPNHVLFRERLTQALLKSRRRPARVCAVLFLDLDRFKNVNDSLGHLVGDQLLRAFADRIGRCLRGEDTFARLGGDEFAILLEDVPATTGAIDVARRVAAELKQPFQLGRHEVFATSSIGITLSSAEQHDADSLLRDADTAMYRAKARGRGRYEVFDREMHAAAARLLQLEHDLRRAIERREFRLLYQPIMALGSGRLAGFEALLRWQSPTRGLVLPAEFVPVAEEMGAIIAIGRWVLRKACAQLAAWRSHLPAARALHVAVNVSSRQLATRELVNDVREVLDETGLPARHLQLEITESTFIDDIDLAKGVLGQLKAMGVQLSLDDFGTGYSSLSSLHKLPFDTLKIDRSFIADMRRGGDHQVVRAILTLAHSLGMTTVAEGIERADQLQELRQLSCGYGQGFHYARPAAASAIGRMLIERHLIGAGVAGGRALGGSVVDLQGAADSTPERVPPEVTYPIQVPQVRSGDDA